MTLPLPSSSWSISLTNGSVTPLSLARPYAPRPRTERACGTCGASFTGAANRRFCSAACQPSSTGGHAKALYERRRAAGLCVACGAPGATMARCDACRAAKERAAVARRMS